MRVTQHHKIIKHCINAKDHSISSREALIDHAITCLHKRVGELEHIGYKFTRQRKVHPTTGQRYTRYQLQSEVLPPGHWFGIGRDLQQEAA